MIITIINQKGGTGKTTTAAALVSYYQQQGRKALAIDLDPQCNLSLALGANTEHKTILGALTREADPAECIQHTPNGDIICSSPTLAAADIMLTETGKEYRLQESLDSIAGQYEHIIIDSPPALGILSINALVAADTCIIPCQAEIFSIQGLKQLADTIKQIRKYCNPKLSIAGILLTQHNGRTVLARDLQTIIEKQAEAMETKVFKTAIRDSVTIRQAQAMQQGIFTLHGAVIDDYRAFIEEFENGRI